MIAVSIPLPYGLEFVEWAIYATEQLAEYGIAPPTSEDEWATWANALFSVPDLVAQGIPQPIGFANWREWAERFVGTVR